MGGDKPCASQVVLVLRMPPPSASRTAPQALTCRSS